MTNVPDTYLRWRSSMPFDEISIGSGGLKLAQADRLKSAQIGYSISADGASFCSGHAGDWQPEWLVIGEDTGVGDPLILDTIKNTVLTAMNGVGEWEPVLIAVSVEGFAFALGQIRQLSVGREHPVAMARNPIPAHTRDEALASIAAANPNVHMQFWELLIKEDE